MLRLGLALLAALARAAPPGPGDEAYRYYYEDVYRPFFELDAAGTTYRASRPGANPSQFPARKAPGAFRVFLVGGSTMAGYNGPLALPEALSRVLPGVEVEVMNCGMTGYDSARELLVAREVARYRPDAVVFLTGHNDFFIMHPGLAPRLLAPALARLRKAAWLRRLRKAPEPPSPEGRLEKLEANARAEWRAAREAGAVPVAALPPLNYRDNAPGTDLPLDDPAMAGGLSLLAQGRAREARALWEAASATAAARVRPFLLFERARASDDGELYLEATDDPRAYPLCGRTCRSVLAKAAVEEGAAVADLDAAFRAAAAPRMPGFDAFSDTIHWQGELNGTASAAIVRALASDPRLASRPWDRAALAELERDARARARLWTAPRRRDLRDKLLYYASAETRTARGPSMRAAVWLEALLRAEPALGRPAAYAAALAEVDARRKHFAHLGQEAMSEDPGSRLLRLNLALAQARLGRRREALALLDGLDEGAAKSLRAALRGEAPRPQPAAAAAPPRPEPGSDLGRRLRSWTCRSLARAGLSGAGLAYMRAWHRRRPAELGPAELRDWLTLAASPRAGGAGAAALETLESLPLAPEDWPTLARAWQAYGKPERALPWWDKAVARGGPPRLLHERALALHGAGRLEAAVAGLRAAVGADPTLAEAWLSLGTILENQGRWKESAAAYRSGAGLDSPVQPLLRESLARIAPKAQ